MQNHYWQFVSTAFPKPPFVLVSDTMDDFSFFFSLTQRATDLISTMGAYGINLGVNTYF